MKTIYVLRHAKAKRSHSSGTDHARRLNSRGRSAATRIGAYMKGHDYEPEVIISSSAARTVETMHGVAESFDQDPDITTQDALYLAGPDRLLRTCQVLDDRSSSVLLIGHNPGMHEFSLLLVQNREDPLVRKLIGSFPTGALAVFRFEAEQWAKVAPAQGRLVDLVFPRELPDDDA